MSGSVRLSDLFKYYKQGLPYQSAAVQMLEEQLMKTAPELMSRDNEWFKVWSQAGKQDPPKQVVLSVPYEWQRDNKSGSGSRECFSSSAAMVAKFYGKVGSDDEYNGIRARYGDTTDSIHHISSAIGVVVDDGQRIKTHRYGPMAASRRRRVASMMQPSNQHWTTCLKLFLKGL